MSTQKNEHNPDNLSRKQVGEGFRLLTKTEVASRQAMLRTPGATVKDVEAWWSGQWCQGWAGNSTGITYRIRITPPTDTTGSGREGETDAFLTTALTEQIEQARKWKEHYDTDPKGQSDKAFWDGKERAYSECLNLVQSNSAAREPSTPSKGETPEIVRPLAGGELNCVQHVLKLLGGEDDPLTLMNKLTSFKESPPEMDERWLKKIASCSEMIVAQKRNIDVLTSQVEALRRDGERLQWMIDHAAMVYKMQRATKRRDPFSHMETVWVVAYTDKNGGEVWGSVDHGHTDPRAAIDSAQRQEGR